MALFKVQNLIQIYTKTHHFKKNSRWSMPPNPPNKAHGKGFAMRSMSLRNMHIPKYEKKSFLAPPPAKF